MKILVTGNMGYVGPGVVQQLRASYPAATIVGLDTGYFADVRRLPAGALEGVDTVVHLAAISNDPMGSRYERVTADVNHRATVALAEQARAAGASRFVFASSCSVYGFASDEARTEESAVAPLTAYARSKVLAEQDLAGLAGPGFQVTCLRFATACGMSDRLRLDLVLNDFVAAAVTARTIRILSDGTPWRPLIHVRDMARAIDWAIGRPRAAGDFVLLNAGHDDWNYQVRDLAGAVAKVVSGVEVSVNPDAQPDRRSYRVSFARFRALAPDHQPRYDLPGTVAELAEGLERMRFGDGEFRASSYIRLNVLASLRERGFLDDELRWTGAARGGG